MTKPFNIASRAIGSGHPPYIIAEMSGNHNGDINRALRLIEEAKKAGADAIKLQTYTADTITIDHDGPGFVIEGGLWNGRKLHDLYREAHTPWDWHPALFAHAKKLGIDCFSSPFDSTAVDLLQRLDAPAYKIASFEIVDTPLIRYTAKTNKPLIISSGMANTDEINEALSAAQESGSGGVALLHCISGYPTPVEQANLRRIPMLSDAHDCPIGLSDHTLGIAASVASVALGAAIVEKHMTLARSDGGPDAEFSLEPNEFALLVRESRNAFEALGNGEHGRASAEEGNVMLRRSLYAVEDIAAGDVFTDRNVRSIRPGYGLAPKLLPELLGKHARLPIARGTPLNEKFVEESL